MSLKNSAKKRILSYGEAIREALYQEMSRDRAVIVMGQGVDDPKRILGTTKGLLEKFGEKRVFDTPLAEDGITGIAIGAALAGLRPVMVHIRMDFMLLAMNQIVNIAAKLRYMFGGSVSVPLVIRCIIGRRWGQGPQHSQSLYPFFMNIPGLKIIAPSNPYDAKGGMISSIRDDNPVIFIEHRLLYYQKSYVPSGIYASPLGKARIVSPGKDVTLVGISHMAVECLRAKQYLLGEGINAEVVDPVSIYPLDIDSIEASVRKTRRLIIVDNAWGTAAAGAEIITSLLERKRINSFVFRRMGFSFVPCPTTPALEKYFYPDAKKIATEAHSLFYPKKKHWYPKTELKMEELEFKGPF
ncbi:MAG TPA: transketolase C-terminal domain-containing protein [Candidatus Omnitrophota bacterium]|nr:transketolase C-terminal domain-containing protein [Candidatus Omnitrophota bacterium]